MSKLIEIKEVGDRKTAEKVILFLQSKEAFDLEMTDFRIKARKKAVFGSLENEHHKYWYVENEKGIVIGAVGVAENERKNGGYYLDYFAVHKDYRRQGLGEWLFEKAEKQVKKEKGRFMLIDTGDGEKFAPARKFYEKMGYEKVSFIPDYYDIGDSRIDYYKKM